MAQMVKPRRLSEIRCDGKQRKAKNRCGSYIGDMLLHRLDYFSWLKFGSDKNDICDMALPLVLVKMGVYFLFTGGGR